MKKSTFIIFFTDGGSQSVNSNTMYEAVVLIQASRIKYGKEFTIECIKDEDGKLYAIDTHMSFKRTH